MTAVTPEHLQLLSDKRLREVAESTASDGGDRALARAVRYEMKRRRCDVPVYDRYASTPMEAA